MQINGNDFFATLACSSGTHTVPLQFAMLVDFSGDMLAGSCFSVAWRITQADDQDVVILICRFRHLHVGKALSANNSVLRQTGLTKPDCTSISISGILAVGEATDIQALNPNQTGSSILKKPTDVGHMPKQIDC